MPDDAPRMIAPASTEADIAGYHAVLDLARRFGPDRAAEAALYASGHRLWPLVLLLAARGADVGEAVDLLHLQPGELAAVAGVSLPAPPSPLPADQATTFPDDDSDAVWDAGPYLTRQRLTLLRDVPEPVAARLAGPGSAPDDL